MKKNHARSFLESVKEYQVEKLDTFGANPKGVDWNSPESQEIRFRQLLKICDSKKDFSIIDYGCGYGALLGYMQKQGYKNFKYIGYDILDKMIIAAKKIYKNNEYEIFIDCEEKISISDYLVASGIFSLKMDTSNNKWEKYILKTLGKMNRLSKKGFSFNMLTSYSDFNIDRLYYGDPGFYFDYCKRNFSKNVALLHDYNLYDFTILVKKG